MNTDKTRHPVLACSSFFHAETGGVCIQPATLESQPHSLILSLSLFGLWETWSICLSSQLWLWEHLTQLCSHRIEKQPTAVWNAQVPRTCLVVNDLNKWNAASNMWGLGSMSHLIQSSSYMIKWVFQYSRAIGHRIFPCLWDTLEIMTACCNLHAILFCFCVFFQGGAGDVCGCVFA